MAEGRIDIRSMQVAPPLEILMALERGDVGRFNQWLAEERTRPEHQGIQIGAYIRHLVLDASVDLSGVDLSHSYIADMRLQGTRLAGANLANAVLCGDWEQVDATGADFRNARLDLDIERSMLDDANFLHAQIGGDRLLQNRITHSSFQRAQFDYALFQGVENISHSNFTGAIFDNSVFRSTRFVATDFTDARFGAHIIFDLPHAYFDEITLRSNALLDQRHREYHETLTTAEIIPDLPATPDFGEVLDGLFAYNRGVAMGEVHYQLAHGEFLREQLPAMVERGVGIVFFEGFRPSEAQSLFDRFNSRAPGADEALFAYIGQKLRHDLNPSYHESVFASMCRARELGIRIEPMEDRDNANGYADYIRLRDSNREWAQIVTHRLAELEAAGLITPETRYVLYGGAAHTQSTVIEQGVDAMLGIPSIDMGTTNGARRIEVQQDAGRRDADVIVYLPESSAQGTGYELVADGNFYSPRRVALLQSDLQTLGYRVENTQRFDEATMEAIRDFQQRNGLPATGNADERTLEGLNVAFIEAYLVQLGYDATPEGEAPNATPDAYTYGALRRFYQGEDPPRDLLTLNGVSYRLVAEARDSVQRMVELNEAFESQIGSLELNLPSLSFELEPSQSIRK